MEKKKEKQKLVISSTPHRVFSPTIAATISNCSTYRFYLSIELWNNQIKQNCIFDKINKLIQSNVYNGG